MKNITRKTFLKSEIILPLHYLQRKGLATGNGIFFSRNWSPTLERASISSQTVERPAIHGRNAGGIRR